MAEAKEYPNWKLGEKKGIKEKEPVWDQAQKKLQAKLGADWKLDVNWGAIGKATEGNNYRNEAGKYIYTDLCLAFANNDVAKFSDAVVETLNANLCSGGHKVTFTFGEKGQEYPISSRLRIEINKDTGATFVWSPEWFSYSWGEDYFNKHVCNLPGVAVSKPFPGEWTLAEYKSFDEKKGDLEKATAAIRAKLGAGWNVNVDYESIEANTRGNNYRSTVGKYIYEDYILGFANNDINNAKFDADVAEALNDKVGSGQQVTFKYGPKTGTYQYNSRVNVTVSGDGVVIEWSGDWFSYAYGEPYVGNWVLANC